MQIELGDPFLKELIEKPSGATKYLSPSIQNEIVLMLSDATRNSLVNAIKDVPWYSVIVDTTSDINCCKMGRSAQCDDKRNLSWFL